MRTRTKIAFAVATALVTGCAVQAGHSTPAAVVGAIQPVATIATAAQPWQIAATDDAIWVGTTAGVQRIDPQTNAVVATIKTPPNEYGAGIVAGGGAIWVSDWDSNSVLRIDPATNEIVAKVGVGANPELMTFANGSLWVANHRSGSVSRVDPATNTVVATVPAGRVGRSGPQDTAGAYGDIWTAVSNINAVVRIDGTTSQPKATIRLPAGKALACGPFAATATAIWVSSCGELPTVTQINPRTNKAVRTVKVGGWAASAVVVDDKAWYAVARGDFGKSSRIVRVEPGKKKPTGIRELDPSVKEPSGMMLAFGSLWLTDDQGNTVLRYPASVLS